MARGSTGAPRNTPAPDVPAAGGDIRTAQTQDTQERGARHRQTRPGGPETSPDQGRPGKPRGIDRLIAFICGRRTKWVVVVFWLVVVAALGSLAGKLQGAEKRGEERRLLVPAGIGRIDPGTQRAVHIPVQELQPGPGRLRTRQRDYPG